MDLDTTALGMQGSVRRIFKAAPASQRLQDALRGSCSVIRSIRS